jgi:hypothetical protein
MDTLNLNKEHLTTKFEIEQVQKKKQEYKMFGTYLRTKGLKLFYYDKVNNVLKESDIKCSDTIHIVYRDNKFVAVDYEKEKIFTDYRFIHFEALNMKTAKKRLAKYLKGDIELCNLKIPSKERIKFY